MPAGTHQSQCSPVWKTGTICHEFSGSNLRRRSQCSPVWKTGTMRSGHPVTPASPPSLNVVRSGRPEQLNAERIGLLHLPGSQCSPVWKTGTIRFSPKIGVSFQVGLNVVRSGRPEQYHSCLGHTYRSIVSQCSPVWKTGTIGLIRNKKTAAISESQCSPVWKTGTISHGMKPYRLRHMCLNVVRSGRPEQCCCGAEGSTGDRHGLNVVRSGRPEQSWHSSAESRN